MAIEPIQGEGGFVVPAPGFLPAICRVVRRPTASLFVADEIQTGFCRTGDWFACDDEGVVPDLVTTAKGIAGGLPLAAVTGRAEVMDSVHVGGLGGTYGGNPVACAAALGAIEEMRTHDLAGRAREIGALMDTHLKKLSADHPVIADIRGRGAMMAIELCAPGTIDARRRPGRRRVGVLPLAGRRHAHLRHLGQRLPVPAAAVDLRRPARRGVRRGRRRLRRHRMTRTPEEAVRGLWAVLNDRDYDGIADWVTDDCIYYDVPLGPAFSARGPVDIAKRLRVGWGELAAYENHDGSARRRR